MATLTSESAARDTPGRVVPGPLSWSPPEPPHKNLGALIGIPLGVLALAILIVSQLQLPYVALAPGSAEPINSLLRVPKEHAHPPKGSFLLTTVSLESSIGPFDLLRDRFDPNFQVFSRRDIFGDANPREYTQDAAQEMDDSKQAAVVVAFRALGYPVTEHGAGGLIAALGSGDVPAQGHLVAGDAITKVDGVPTTLGQDVTALLAKHKPGDVVALTVTHKDNTTSAESIRLGSRTQTSCAAVVVSNLGACLGVQLGTKNHSFDYPFEVKIETDRVGGPSAGLAFTLALIDELTPGELTGGRNVAVTGTIDVDGTVGDVGGVVQKTAAVRRAHATLFLVPPGEYPEARKHAGKHLKVVQVTTLTEALSALRANGGDSVDIPAQ